MTAIPHLTVHVRRGPKGETVFEVAGDIDFAVVEDLRGRLMPASERGTVVLDLSGVTFCDSSGVRALVEADQSAREHGGTCRIAAPSDDVLRILSLTKTDQTLALFPDVAAALAG